jgi:hypothetical protein
MEKFQVSANTLTLTSIRHLFNVIREKFELIIDSDKGISAYLDPSVQKYNRPEIKTLMNYFKLNSIQINSMQSVSMIDTTF